MLGCSTDLTRTTRAPVLDGPRFPFRSLPNFAFSRVMYSTLHCNFLARPLRSLTFASCRPIIRSSLHAGSFQLKVRHRNVFTAVTRALSTSCVRWSDRKTKGSAAIPPLRENIYTIPNLLTVSRILSCPVLGWSILHDDFFLATGLLVYAGLSDLVGTPRMARLIKS